MRNLIKEARLMQLRAGIITEDEYNELKMNEGIKTIDASKSRFEVEGNEDLKPTDLKPGVIISVIKSFRDREELEDNAGKFEKIEGDYIYWKTKSGRQKSWPHIEDLALVKNLEMTESQLNEEMKAEDVKVGETYIAQMPTSSEKNPERIDVKVKVLGPDRNSDDEFVIEPLEDKRYTNPVSKQENEFSKGKHYGIEAKYLKPVS